jgi:hypothetical protein
MAQWFKVQGSRFKVQGSRKSVIPNDVAVDVFYKNSKETGFYKF